MWIAIASIICFVLGGTFAALLSSMSSATTQDLMQQHCSNCIDNKKRLLTEVLKNDIDWVDMDDNEISDKIIEALYQTGNI